MMGDVPPGQREKFTVRSFRPGGHDLVPGGPSRLPAQGHRTELLAEATRRAREWQLRRFEAWTRDDLFVNDWYRAQGFQQVQAYWHIFMGSRDELAAIRPQVPGLRTVSAFAHYLGDDEGVHGRFERVHRCNRYDLVLEP